MSNKISLTFLSYFVSRVVPASIHTHPKKVIENSEGEGVSTAKIYKEQYEAKLEVPCSWEGLNEKKLSWGR